jgi:hypothetical protein
MALPPWTHCLISVLPILAGVLLLTSATTAAAPAVGHVYWKNLSARLSAAPSLRAGCGFAGDSAINSGVLFGGCG